MTSLLSMTEITLPQSFPEKFSDELLQRMAQDFAAAHADAIAGVFGYGSLIWKFDVPFVRKAHARIHGYRRILGLWSVHYRGTVKTPGLVFGLDRGGSVWGCGYFCDEEAAHRQMIMHIYKREMISGAYRPVIVNAHVLSNNDNLRPKRLLTFALDRHHPQYAGGLTLRQQCAIVTRAHGEAGSNLDYVRQTQRNLQESRIPCRYLDKICKLLPSDASAAF